MKKILSIILALVMCFGLFPCGSLSAPAPEASSEKSPREQQTAADNLKDGNEPSYAISAPASVPITQDQEITAVPVEVTALDMVTGSNGLTPTFLRLVFNGLTLTNLADSSKTIECKIRKNSSDSPSNQKMYNVSAPGSCGVEIVISGETWAAVEPGAYTGSLQYITRWRYSNSTWSGDIETGTIPVTVTVPGTPETWLVNFDLGFYNGYCDPPAEQYVVPGGTAEDPGEFKVNGPYFWVFTGWYTDPGCTSLYDFDTPVTDDLTLYAGYRSLSDQELREWFNGYVFYFPKAEREFEMYQSTGNHDWNSPIGILYFELIDGVDYDPENHVLTFENYTGPVICSSRYGPASTDAITIEIKGVNNIYLGEKKDFQEIWKSNVIFTGDGTLNFDMLGFWSGGSLDLRSKSFGIAPADSDVSVVWDGPTLNMFNMFNPLNKTMDYYESSNAVGPYFTLMSGSVNFELTPVSFGDWHYGRLLLGNGFDLLGGSFHVHYTMDPYVIEMLSLEFPGITPCVTDGTYHVFDAKPGYNGGRTTREPVISANCDFQITVDPEVAAGGFSVIPFVLENFGFTWFDPELMPGDIDSNFYYPNALGDPIADINEIEGLSYDYENYFDLADHPHKLTMENYSGPGFLSVSTNYLNTALEIELIGENTVYCSGFGGLGFDDINLIFTGTGTLRVINCSTGETIAYQSGDLFTPPRAYCLFGIFQMYDIPAGGYQENGHSYMTVDGPEIIIEGGFRNGAVARFDRVTIRSGSLVTDARQRSTSIVYNNSNIPGYFCQFAFNENYNPTDSPNVVVEGGTFVVNYEESPRGYDTFYVIQSPLVAGVRYVYTLGGMEFAPDTLIVVGEQRVFDQEFYAGTFNFDQGIGYAHNPFEGHMRLVQTEEVENGYAVPRVEGGMVYVTVHPDEGMTLMSLSYVGANSDPIQIPKTGDEYVFPLPEGNNDVLITAVFGDAPAITHTVTFLDWDGTVLWQQEVFDREAALPLGEPEREGYAFIGWDVDFSSVTSDLTVTALYEQIPAAGLEGDVNCDGIVDSADLTLAAAFAMSAGEVSEQGILNGDMNSDGLLTAADLSALYSLIQG